MNSTSDNQSGAELDTALDIEQAAARDAQGRTPLDNRILATSHHDAQLALLLLSDAAPGGVAAALDRAAELTGGQA